MPINYNAPIKIRDFRNGDWFWISKHVWQSKELTQSDKVLYGTLAFFANQQNKAWPTIKLLAKFSVVSERQIYRSIKNLEEEDYIKVNRYKIKGQPNEYFLLKTKGDKIAPKRNRVTKHLKKGDKTTPNRVTNSTSNNNNRTRRKNNIQDKPVVDKKVLLRQMGFKIPKAGANYQWQDHTVRVWKAMGLKKSPSPSFFKLFKKAYDTKNKGLLDLAYSFVADADADNPEKLFYWRFNQLLKDK